MIRVALKGLLGRKLRSALTAIAVVLGVAMISGTYVLTDTINHAFDTIFTRSYVNSDAVITGKAAFEADETEGEEVEAPSFPESLLAKVRRLPDVAAAAGGIEDEAQIVGKNGKTVETHGAPALAFSVTPGGEGKRFNPLTLVTGRWPSRPDEVAIDKATASKQDFDVGERIGILAQGPVRSFRLSGIAEFASVASIGGATISVFDLPTAQRLFDKRGKLDIIRVAAKTNVPEATLTRELRGVLPRTAQVRTASAQAKQDAQGVAGFTDFLQKALLAFAGVALFVGAFVIANTLSITIAQRVREFATLRTLGATRRQILRSVVLEALVIGVVASVVGLLLGFALAKGLNSLFVSIGIDLPQSATVVKTRTIVAALLVGILVTLLASLRPALRATRVPAIAAVREGAVLPRSRFARLGLPFALTVLALGIVLLCYGIFAADLATGVRLLALAVGCLTLFLGVALVAPRVVRPLAAVLGWPGAHVGGAAGELARENAQRNPNRTASTAAALMIGLALVTFVSVLANGIRSSFESAVDELFVADYALTAQEVFAPLTAKAEAALRRSPDAEVVSGVRQGTGNALGKNVFVTAVDPNIDKVVNLTWKEGGGGVPARLRANGVFLKDDYASDHAMHVGSRIALESPTGRRLDLRVIGVFAEPKGGSPFGDLTISTASFDNAWPNPENLMAFANTRGGVNGEAQRSLEQAVRAFPDAKILTASQFKKDALGPLDSLLNLLYVLLGLSIIVSFFGIVNTLVLTVFERTRELGMLRAVGMTRRQVRRMIRYESVVTSLIGAALGIAVGLFLAALVTRALSSEGIVFAVPWGSLVVFVVAAILVGLIAAILPARRASRLNVLEALQYE